MKKLKFLAVLLLAITTGGGALMLAPSDAEATALKTASCDCTYSRCDASGACIAALANNCEISNDGNGIPRCTQTECIVGPQCPN